MIAIGLLTPKNTIAAIKSGVFFSLFKPVFKPAQPQLNTFIGQSVWLHKHMEDYSRMMAPLRDIVKRYPAKTKHDISHVWLTEPEAANAFTAQRSLD